MEVFEHKRPAHGLAARVLVKRLLHLDDVRAVPGGQRADHAVERRRGAEAERVAVARGGIRGSRLGLAPGGFVGAAEKEEAVGGERVAARGGLERGDGRGEVAGLARREAAVDLGLPRGLVGAVLEDGQKGAVVALVRHQRADVDGHAGLLVCRQQPPEVVGELLQAGPVDLAAERHLLLAHHARHERAAGFSRARRCRRRRPERGERVAHELHCAEGDEREVGAHERTRPPGRLGARGPERAVVFVVAGVDQHHVGPLVQDLVREVEQRKRVDGRHRGVHHFHGPVGERLLEALLQHPAKSAAAVERKARRRRAALHEHAQLAGPLLDGKGVEQAVRHRLLPHEIAPGHLAVLHLVRLVPDDGLEQRIVGPVAGQAQPAFEQAEKGDGHEQHRGREQPPLPHRQRGRWSRSSPVGRGAHAAGVSADRLTGIHSVSATFSAALAARAITKSRSLSRLR